MTGYRCSAGCGLPVEVDPTKILVHGAHEHNLKHICFEVPKGKLVALTGPSGSGKSSIAVQVLQHECLRQLLESLGMTTDHIAKVKVERIIGLSPSIGVSQRKSDCNPRSTVGTRTGILTILRNLFAALGEGEEKLTMAHFSYNAAKGACETCNGTGELIEVNLDVVLDEKQAVSQGGVDLWDRAVAAHYGKVLEAAGRHYGFGFDADLPIGSYTPEQRNLLLYGNSSVAAVKAPKKVSEGRFEGLVPYLRSRAKSHPPKYFRLERCATCEGSRLGTIAREVRVGGRTISEVADLPLRGVAPVV